MLLATLDGKELTQTLRRISKAPRELLGSAFWHFEEELVLAWTSYEQPLDARIAHRPGGPIMVAGGKMNQLAAVIDLRGETSIEWDEERSRLKVGVHSVPATMTQAAPAFSLPIDARERTLLAQMTHHPRQAVEDAGHGEDMVPILKRWNSSIQAAADALAWTGLDRNALEAILAETIRSGLENLPADEVDAPFPPAQPVVRILKP